MRETWRELTLNGLQSREKRENAMPRSEHPKVFEVVRDGIARSKGLVEKLTNYHGGPVKN